MVGPMNSYSNPGVDPPPPGEDDVRAAGTSCGALFIYPLAERWFSDDVGLIGPDRISPTDAGHA